MADFANLTLSDFYEMEIGEREDGSLTPIIDHVNGEPIGLVGFRGNKNDSDFEIKEHAYLYYLNLMEELKKINH
jgi:hypothetical protein